MINNKTIVLLFICLVACTSNNNEDKVNSAESGLIETIATDLYFEQKTNSVILNIKDSLESVDHKIRFDSLMAAHNELAILRINDSNCGLCIEVELEEILAFKTKLGTNQIAVFATFKSERNLKLITKGLSGSGIPIFTIDYGELKLPVDEANAPYYFTINSNHIVNHTFIPVRGIESLNESYFNAISSIFRLEVK